MWLLWIGVGLVLLRWLEIGLFAGLLRLQAPLLECGGAHL